MHSGLLFSHEKIGYPAICFNMDGPWVHYAKQDKSDRERQVLYDITNIESYVESKKVKPVKHRE